MSKQCCFSLFSFIYKWCTVYKPRKRGHYCHRKFQGIISISFKLINILKKFKLNILFSGSRWRVKKLTYRISKYPKSITDKASVDKEIAKAFSVWSDYTDLSFTPKKSGQV